MEAINRFGLVQLLEACKVDVLKAPLACASAREVD